MFKKITFITFSLLVAACSDDTKTESTTNKKEVSPTIQKYFDNAGKVVIKGLNDSAPIKKEGIDADKNKESMSDLEKKNDEPIMEKYYKKMDSVKIEGLD